LIRPKEIIEELNLFEKESLSDIRILGIATYIEISSTKRLQKSSQSFTPRLTYGCMEVDKEV